MGVIESLKNFVTSHPGGLWVLFIVEAWERFSYYSMRALLVLFLTAPNDSGQRFPGFHWCKADAFSLYGFYTTSVYITALVGGALADSVLGTHRSLLIGATIMATGHLVLVLSGYMAPRPPPDVPSTLDNAPAAVGGFYAGLALIAIGVGFFKPSASTMIGEMYDAIAAKAAALMPSAIDAEEGEGKVAQTAERSANSPLLDSKGVGAADDPSSLPPIARKLATDTALQSSSPNLMADAALAQSRATALRDGGYAIFYMGINIGAALAGVIGGSTALHYGWHVGFGTATVGMIGGLSTYILLRPHVPSLNSIGHVRGRAQEVQHEETKALTSRETTGYGASDALDEKPLPVEEPVLYCGCLFNVLPTFAQTPMLRRLLSLNNREKRGLLGLIVTAAVLFSFFVAFEQAGSSLNTIANDYVRRGDVPAAWFQSLNSVFLVSMSPFFAWMWGALAAAKLSPAPPVRFAVGFAMLGAAYACNLFGSREARYDASDCLMGPHWLVLYYFLCTVGEVILSPQGLSMVSVLAPAGLKSFGFSLYFVAIGMANFLASRLAALALGKSDPKDSCDPQPVGPSGTMIPNLFDLGDTPTIVPVPVPVDTIPLLLPTATETVTCTVPPYELERFFEYLTYAPLILSVVMVVILPFSRFLFPGVGGNA